MDESILDSYLSWQCLCENTNLSEAFFEKYEHLEVLDWYCLCKNNNISESFFEKHIDKIVFDYEDRINSINVNSNISEKFFKKYIKKIKIEDLFLNTFRLYHKKDKVISWLRKNPQYSFDKILENYF